MSGWGDGGSTWPGCAVFTLASAACAVAPDARPADRGARGAGARRGRGDAAGLTILAAAFPAERRGAVVGIWGGIGGLAVAGGPLVGGAVTQGLDWHWIFWINVPFGVLAAGRAAPARLPRRAAAPGGPARRARGGAVGGRGGPARLGPRPGRRVGVGRRPRAAGVLGGLAVLAGFVGWERRAASPMLPLRLLPGPRLRGGQRHRVHVVRGDHVGGVPHRAVLPARPRLLAAGRRAADAALDGHADAGRAGGRGAGRPHRHPAAAGHRAGPAGGRPGLGRAARVRRAHWLRAVRGPVR